MRRRDLIASLGGAVALPLAARPQQKAMPVIGYLASGSPGGNAPLVAAFRQGLGETGYVEGQNLTIEYRWAEDRDDRLPAMAADLVGQPTTFELAINLKAAKTLGLTVPQSLLVSADEVIE